MFCKMDKHGRKTENRFNRFWVPVENGEKHLPEQRAGGPVQTHLHTYDQERSGHFQPFCKRWFIGVFGR